MTDTLTWSQSTDHETGAIVHSHDLYPGHEVITRYDGNFNLYRIAGPYDRVLVWDNIPTLDRCLDILWSLNPANQCASNLHGAHYSSSHNGYVPDPLSPVASGDYTGGIR
jgi:hypothetical protein